MDHEEPLSILMIYVLWSIRLADMKSHCPKKAAELWFVAQLCQTA